MMPKQKIVVSAALLIGGSSVYH